MRSLWAYIEGMVDLSLPLTATNSSDLAKKLDLEFWSSSKRVHSSCKVCFGASQFFYKCCNIVLVTHEEPLPLGMY